MILADDCWQECGSHGAEGWTYHNELGRPVIDQEKFPNMRSMFHDESGPLPES
eukprot:SAG25_NODE_12766_length_275_cov_0.880682_2_plen_52_part_01